jgi:hypothetical protein
MEAKFTSEARLRLQVQVRKARRSKAEEAAVHADRHCQAIKQIQNAEVRQATPEEVANMEPCGHRACRIARGEDIDDSGSEPLAEPQGDSVRTVSGGAFESNRRRH